MIFAELRLGNGKAVRIPFVCQRCGKCCRILSKIVLDPVEKKIYMENLEEIAEHVNLEELVERLCREVDVKHPVKLPCPFFKDNSCTIHPIRPRSCRIFPLGEGLDQGIGCPGLKRLMAFVEAFKPKEVEFRFVEEGLKKMEVSKNIFKKYLSLNPSEEELEEFFKLNAIPSERSPRREDI